MPHAITIEPIGHISTPFREKFGIPRQPGLVKSVRATVHLNPHPHWREALKGLETFSHVWIVGWFHQTGSKNWLPSIRPPRLGGNRKIGVLASRSPHRPNPIFLSAVQLIGIRFLENGGAEIEVAGLDALDGTPILDIKPYLPYADSIPDASSGWASEPVARFEVEWTPRALEELRARCSSDEHFEQSQTWLTETLALDPRPGFQQRRTTEEDNPHYGVALGEWDIHYTVVGVENARRMVVTGVSDLRNRAAKT